MRLRHACGSFLLQLYSSLDSAAQQFGPCVGSLLRRSRCLDFPILLRSKPAHGGDRGGCWFGKVHALHRSFCCSGFGTAASQQMRGRPSKIGRTQRSRAIGSTVSMLNWDVAAFGVCRHARRSPSPRAPRLSPRRAGKRKLVDENRHGWESDRCHQRSADSGF